MPPSADPTINTSSADEATPLLGAPESGPPATYSHSALSSNVHEAQDGDGSAISLEEPPMPYVQIILLCYACLAEPIAYFAIFPFINEMLERNGHLREEDVGFWAGAIESLFSLVQMVLMIFYGRMADRLGRKPVLVFSLTGVSCATALFGLSRTLWQMILFRCFAGVFAGSVVTVRTMISENTTKSTQGRAFSWYMFTRNLGILLGPIIGGGLSNPADQFPDTFGNWPFFIEHPYALSTFVAGAICMTGPLSCIFFLKETLKRKVPGQSQPETPMSTLQVLRCPGLPMVLYIFGYTALLGLAFTAIWPLTMFTSVEKGGFAFSPQQISFFLALAGGSQALWMLLGFPILQSRLGTGTLLRIVVAVWPIFILSYPLLNVFLRQGWTTPFWVGGIATSIVGSGVALGYACVQLCLNDVCPSPELLGTANALALTVSSGVRAVTPALFTSIYAFGVNKQWVNGEFAWFVLAGLAVLLNVVVVRLPEAVEGRPEKKKHKKMSNGGRARGDSGSAEDGGKQRTFLERVANWWARFVALFSR